MKRKIRPAAPPVSAAAVMMISGYKRLDTNQLASLWGVHAVTLRKWRLRKGAGPRFITIGRTVRYRLSDIVAFERKWVSK